MDKFDQALEIWDFQTACESLDGLSKNNIEYCLQYCIFLADIGELEKLRNIIIARQLLSMQGKQFHIIQHLHNIDQKLRDFSNNSFISKIYKLATDSNVVKLFEILKLHWDKEITNDLNAENNMILCFAFNKLVQANLLDLELAVLLINHMFVNKNINVVRKKYLLSKLIDYFLLNQQFKNYFYKLKVEYYNHLQKLLAMLHQSSDELGRDIYLHKLFTAIRRANNLNLAVEENYRAKVAVCISGMFRADFRPLESIYKNIVIPLNADVFFHTWDVQQNWIGAARVGDRFWYRTFRCNEATIPVKLNDMKFFKDNFPSIFCALMTENIAQLDVKDMEKFKFTKLLVENEEKFLKNFGIDDKFLARGSYNQIKMFYGIWKAFCLVKEYEQQVGIRYDYIIRLRPDVPITKGISFGELKELSANNIAIATGIYGVQDVMFYATRNIYEIIANIFNKSLQASKVSPFVNFPKYDAHAVMFAYLLHSNISPKMAKIKYILETVADGKKILNLQESLIADLTHEKIVKFPEECKFLENLLKKYA